MNSQSVEILNADISNYPNISTEFYVVGANGQNIENFNETQISIFENEILNEAWLIEKGNKTELHAVSTIFIVDISLSMKGTPYQLANESILNFIDYYSGTNFEIAVLGFNTATSIISDFTNNKNILEEKLNNAVFREYSDFNIPFLNNTSNNGYTAFSFAKQAQYPVNFILITNNSNSANAAEIINLANEQNIRIFTLNINSNVPTSLQSIANGTQGESIGKISNNEKMKAATSIVFNKIFNTKAHKLTFTTNICSTKNNFSIRYTNFQSSNIIINIPEQVLPGLIITPSNTYNFGEHNIGESSSRIFNLKSSKGNVKITTVLSGSNSFQIDNPLNEFELPQGESISITVRYTAAQTTRESSQIIINGDVCVNNIIYLTANSENILENTLKLNYPNGGEYFNALSTQDIFWEGVTPEEWLSLEYSTNAGENWLTLTDSISGLSEKWVVRNTPSDECLMKVKHISKTEIDGRIIKFEGHNGGIKSINWIGDGQFLYSLATDNEIIIWDMPTEELFLNFLKLPDDIMSFNISPNDNFLAYAKSDTIVVYNINEIMPVINLGFEDEKFIFVKWTLDSEYLVAATETGKLIIWRTADYSYFKTINAHQEPITSIDFSPDNLLIATGDNKGKIKLWNTENFEFESEFGNNNEKINSISFNSQSTILAIAYERPQVLLYSLNGDLVSTLPNTGSNVKLVKWGPLGKYIITVSESNIVKIYSLAESKYLDFEFTYHNALVKAVSWSKDGKLVATGDNSGVIYIWSPDDFPYQNKVLQEDISDNLWSIVNPSIESRMVNFGKVKVDTHKDSLLVAIIKNTGKALLSIEEIIIGGTNIDEFEIMALEYPIMLEPNETIDIMFKFNPTSAGLKNAWFDVYHTKLNSIGRFSLRGEGISGIISVVPNIIDFGNNFIEQFRDTTIIVKNLTDVQQTITSIIPLGPDLIQFEVTSQLPIFIPANDERTIDIRLNAQHNGITSNTFAISIENFDLQYFVDVYTNIIPPVEFDYPKNVDFDIALCEENKLSKTIEISIEEQGIVEVYAYDIIGNGSDYFSALIEPFPYDLTNTSPLEIELKYEPLVDFVHQVELVIQYKFNEQFNGEIRINLNGTIEKADYEFSNRTIHFNDVELDTPADELLVIRNTGNVDLLWEIPEETEYFEFLSFVPNPHQAQENSIATIRFKGAETRGIYRDTIQLIDICNNSIDIILAAFVDENQAIIVHSSQINFPDIYCEENTSEMTIVLQNAGNIPLIITAIQSDNPVFQIKDYSGEEIEILANSEKQLTIIFSPDEPRYFEGLLSIFSNAENTDEGKSTILLNASYFASDFVFSPNEINIDKVLANFPHLFTFDIINTGNMEIVLNIVEISGLFTVNNIEPETLGEQEIAKGTITFSGASVPGEYTGYLTLSDEFCGLTKTIIFTINVEGFAQAGLQAGNVTASPGDTVYIPIILYSPENVELPSVTAYGTTLKYNYSLLVPLPPTPVGILNGKERIIELSNLPASQTEGVIAEIKFIATLGNAKETDIILENSYIVNEPSMLVENRNGSFLLKVSDSDLIDGTGIIRLFPNEPNPATEETIIKYHLIEKGYYKLELFDHSARKIATLIEEYAEPDTYEYTLNTKKYASGTYYIVLSTPSHYLMRKMLIVR